MSTPATEGSPSSTRRSWPGTGLLILVLPIAVCLMLLAFLTPALNSGPEDLPLAVAGPAPAVEQITDALEERSPGAFEITEYDDAEQAEQAVADREAIGAVTVGQQGVEILKASGAGTPYGTMMDNIATGLEEQQKAQAQQAQGQEQQAPAQGDQTAAQGGQAQGQQAPSGRRVGFDRRTYQARREVVMDGTEAGSSGVEQVVVYLRISEDRTGAEAGVERQRQDCLDLCARLGITDPAVFMDNDISAYSGKKRPGYLDLLERVKLGPSRIVAWHVDRLYRRPRELEDLIDLVEAHPIRIETVKGGAFDLNTHEGRLMARQLVAIASYESPRVWWRL